MRARSLALLLLLPLLAACGGGTADPAASPAPRVTRTVVVTQSPLPLPTIEGKPVQFRSADGRIGCDLQPAYVLCNVERPTFTAPKKPGDCRYSWGKAVEFAIGSKGSFFCGHGEDYTSSKRVLRAGQALKVGLVTCRALASSVRCEGEGHGFVIGPKSFQLL